MPSKNETYQYKMLSDQALAKFRIFCAAGKLPTPDGAYDAKPKFARDQAPVDDMVALIAKLLDENKRLKSMASDQDPDRNDKHDELMADLVALKDLLEAKQGNLGQEELKQALALIGHWVTGNANVNRETSPVGDEDQPPMFEGRPRRDGGLAADAKPWARLIERDDWQASRQRMLKHMSRIQNLG